MRRVAHCFRTGTEPWSCVVLRMSWPVSLVSSQAEGFVDDTAGGGSSSKQLSQRSNDLVVKDDQVSKYGEKNAHLLVERKVILFRRFQFK